MNIGIGNNIDKDVVLPPNIAIGNYNTIKRGVRFEVNPNSGRISIGDCNIINENSKFIVGTKGIQIGDWNVFHNHMLTISIGHMPVTIGYNCWFGQNTILDGSGGLTIGNGVRVGMYSQVWSHVASGEQLEGCLLFGYNHTTLENDVWLVGSCIVASGSYLSEKTICLTSSFIQGKTDARSTYSGNPAKKLDKVRLWVNPSLEDKLSMMRKWATEFCSQYPDVTLTTANDELVLSNSSSTIVIGCSINNADKNYTYFDLSSKTYFKKLTELERQFYKYLYNHKARFTPVE